MRVSITMDIDELANKALAERTGQKKLSRADLKAALLSLLEADVDDIVGDYQSRVENDDSPLAED